MIDLPWSSTGHESSMDGELSGSQMLEEQTQLNSPKSLHAKKCGKIFDAIF
jgi:hypothetical protein